jgi:hypothetical protein
MKANNRSPKIDKKQYLRYMKTYLWAIRQKEEDLIKVVMGRHMYKYPVDAISLEQAITDMEAESQLRETGISTTDMYAIKEAVDYLRKNQEDDTKRYTNPDEPAPQTAKRSRRTKSRD